jgi:7,8-dihydropterin-6-yl-methyl-4-(beta-D-ribofuranosyl)aminobenzene 5'-phosphate synthase
LVSAAEAREDTTMEQANLQPVDSAEVTILVDTFVDILLASSDVARRAPLRHDWSAGDQLRAEHGYAIVLTVQVGEQRQSVLYDAGLGRDTAIYNMDVLEIRPADLRAIVLSHGHADHHAGLEGVVRRVGRSGLPLVLHPDAWRDRRVVLPSGEEMHMPPPSRADLESVGVEVVDERGPSLLLDGTVLVSGQTDRVTEFEKGFPLQQARTDAGGWEPDPWIWDDQSVIVNVGGKGLVVMSSCSHSGAVNVLLNAQRVTGEPKVHAFVGGLHLTGGLFESIIPATVAEIASIGPEWVVPGHCTGWRATHELARALPDAYIQTSVGTTLRFAAS